MKKVFGLILIIAICSFCGRGKSEERQNENNTSVTSGESIQNGENDKTINCFVYHRFGDSRFPSTNISTTKFRKHLDYLKSNGFEVMTLSNAIEFLKKPGENKKVAVITIDDGYNSFYENGLPLLKKYSFPATLFINTETVGGGDYMDWNKIKAAKIAGVEIGNHTHSHAFFLNLPESERYTQFESEIEKSQDIIEEQLGEKPKVFAYPYGEYDAEMLDIVKEFDFAAAVAQNSGVIHSGSNLFALPRFPMAEAYASLDRFSQKANMFPVHVMEESPKSFILSNPEEAPKLTLVVKKEDLRSDQFQCFVQGGSCDFQVNEQSDGTLQLTAQAESPLTARRTLYTLTVPDKNGNWHWFSHLWINPEVPDR